MPGSSSPSNCSAVSRSTGSISRTIVVVMVVVVLHEGPNGDLEDQHGNTDVRATIEAGGVGFTVCGHSHWEEPFATHESGERQRR